VVERDVEGGEHRSRIEAHAVGGPHDPPGGGARPGSPTSLPPRSRGHTSTPAPGGGAGGALTTDARS
jgi:hypothetical protein